MICNGHDCAVALGKALRHFVGSKNAITTFGEEIESRLRLAFEADHFRQTALYQRIKEWEARSAPYVCLRI